MGWGYDGNVTGDVLGEIGAWGSYWASTSYNINAGFELLLSADGWINASGDYYRFRGFPIRYITCSAHSALVSNTDMGWGYSGVVWEGSHDYVDSNGYIWASTSSAVVWGYSLDYYSDNTLNSSAYHSRRNGFPIRYISHYPPSLALVANTDMGWGYVGLVYGNELLREVGLNGHFWSAASRDESIGYNLRYSPDWFDPSGGGERYAGFSIRCIAKTYSRF